LLLSVPKTPTNAFAQLGSLFSLNHGLLVSLGVSHPRLDRIVELVSDAGAGYTKLTGAGGGGCAITLLDPAASPAALQRLYTQLDDEGFERFETELGGEGVGVLWPAILKKSKGGKENGAVSGLDGASGGEDEDGDEEDEEHGVEIDQDKFLRAEGREGVERLVGVSNGVGGEKGSGWKFWS
jgi:mevalonate kinase